MGGMNDFSIAGALQYEYFANLAPDTSIFDVIEKKYYNSHPNNDEIIEDNIYFFKAENLCKIDYFKTADTVIDNSKTYYEVIENFDESFLDNVEYYEKENDNYFKTVDASRDNEKTYYTINAINGPVSEFANGITYYEKKNNTNSFKPYRCLIRILKHSNESNIDLGLEEVINYKLPLKDKDYLYYVLIKNSSFEPIPIDYLMTKLKSYELAGVVF